MMKILVIGGVAAGTKTAAKLKRELGEDSEILLLNEGPDISYAGCGLPYYVGDLIKEESELLVNTPESYSRLTGVQVKCGVRAEKLDPKAKIVTATCLASGEQQQYSYDKLVVATGAAPVKPPLPGIDLPGVYTLRTPKDASAIKEAAKNAKRAVVCGGGFIGPETAENLACQGLKVCVIDMAPQIMPGFDIEFAEYAERHLGKAGIPVFTGDRLTALEGKERVEKVRTESRALKADLVVLSLGIRPNTAMLAEAGAELAPNKTVLVNEYLETSLPDVYAAGDCACVKNLLTGQPAWSPMGSSANLEGRLLAKDIAGKKKAYRGVLGTTVVKLAGLNAGKTGLSETAARQAGLDPCAVTITTDDKAHYYPGASVFIIKLVADRASRKLLGLQVLGSGAVDKIVDIAATAITLGAELAQLDSLDLAYAPPFSTAIHPFVTAVQVLENKLDGDLDSLTLKEVKELEEPVLIDVSKAPALHSLRYIAVPDINGPVEGLPKDRPVVVVCAKGKQAYLAQNRLRRYGYENTKVLEGGSTFNEVE